MKKTLENRKKNYIHTRTHTQKKQYIKKFVYNKGMGICLRYKKQWRETDD